MTETIPYVPKKIALIGSAPSSVALAPYDDPTWQIWGCSPGARPYVRRVDAWFEMHLWEPNQPWFSAEYIDFMAKMKTPVFMLEPVAAIPFSCAYPKQGIIDYFGVEAVWFYASTLSWMLAAAIEAGADEIGLWGVDMSAAEEVYTHQRAGCQYFIGQAMKRGIKVTVPQQSDLLRPTPLYGYNELDGMHQKLLARLAELDNRLNIATAQHEQSIRDVMYLRGAREDADYNRKTFVSDPQIMGMIDQFTKAPPATPSVLSAAADAAAAAAQAVKDALVVTPAPEAPTKAGDSPVEDLYHRAINYDAGEEKIHNYAHPVHGNSTAPEVKIDVTGMPLLPVPPVTWASTPAPDFINGLG